MSTEDKTKVTTNGEERRFVYRQTRYSNKHAEEEEKRRLENICISKKQWHGEHVCLAFASHVDKKVIWRIIFKLLQ